MQHVPDGALFHGICYTMNQTLQCGAKLARPPDRSHVETDARGTGRGWDCVGLALNFMKVLCRLCFASSPAALDTFPPKAGLGRG